MTYTSREWYAAQLAKHGSTAAISRATGIPRPTLARWAKLHGLKSDHPQTKHSSRATPPPTSGTTTTGKPFHPERPGATITDDTATLISRPNPRGTATLEPDDLFRQYGLNPAEWTFDATLNAWDALTGEGGVTTLHQLKVVARRRRPLDLILPARVDGWRPTPPRTPRVVVVEPEHDYVTTDLHAPYHSTAKHRAQCRLLADLRPACGYELGDMLDLPKPSRHRPTPTFDTGPQACIDGAYRVFAERVAASPTTRWRALLGNHDDRIRIAATERVPELLELHQADGGPSPFDLAFLLRFDELGIELVRPVGEYHAAEVTIAEGIPGKPWTMLKGRHGTHTAGKGAPGAGKAVDRLTCSLIQGHDHTQGMVTITRWDGHGEPADLLAISAGCSTTRDAGLGYAPNPNWQLGDVVVTRWPDGHWNAELVRWIDGELYFRGRRYPGD